jgi:hypothetical protein
MKTYRITAFMLMALPLSAQTAAELLQKGIFDQETAGDLDGAIAIYHQIVNSGSSPRDVAAQAQYRLAQSLLQKGDLPNGAQEFANLARNYADYGKLVSNLATQARGLSLNYEYDFTAEQRAMVDRAKAELEAQRLGLSTREQQAKLAAAMANLEALAAQQQGLSAGRGGRGGGRSMSSPRFDGPATTVTGIVASIAFVVPEAHGSLRVGDQVTITGILANGGETTDGLITARATTITGPDGHKVFDRAILSPSPNPCHWVSDTVPPPCPASK